MRNWVPKLLMVSILFVSMEGVADSVEDQVFHQTHHAHVDEVGGEWYPDTEGGGHTTESCEHFCHLHAVALITLYESFPLRAVQSFASIPSSQSFARAVPPPTPPPNH